MRINYFSSLPPVPSAVAAVSEQVIPALSQYAAVTVWTDQSDWSVNLANYAEIQQYTPHSLDWSKIIASDLNVYHIGHNIHYHDSLWAISQRVPGLVILHDFQLQCLGSDTIGVPNQDAAAWIQAISHRYGVEAGQVVTRFFAGELPIAAVEDYGMAEWVLSNAAAVMVHTHAAREELIRHDRWCVGYQPLPLDPAASPEPPDRFRTMNQTGEQCLGERHSADAYARAIVSFAEQIKSGYQDLSAQHWVTRSVQTMAPWQLGHLGAPLFTRLSEAISWLSQAEDNAGCA